MATISGKRFQITDGASTPTNLFPYTVTEAVYGLSSVISTARSGAVSDALGSLTLNGSAISGSAAWYAAAASGTTGQILKATTSGAPVWTSAALGANNKPIYLNSSGVLTEGVACLPLAGGTMTGPLTITGSSDTLLAADTANSTGSYIRLRYNTGGTAVTGYIGLSNGKLVYYSGGDKEIWHAGNAGTGYAWGCTTLTASSHIYMANNTDIYWKDTSSTDRLMMRFNANHQLLIGYGTIAKSGTTFIYGNAISFNTGSTPTEYMRITSSGNVGIGTASPDSLLTIATPGSDAIPTFHIGNAGAGNVDAGHILFQNVGRNGFRISSVYADSAARQALVFYCSNNTASPYGPVWSEVMRITNTGLVGIGTSMPGNKLQVADSFCVSGTGYLSMVFADATQNRWIWSKRSTANDLHLIEYTSSQAYDTVMAFQYSTGYVAFGTTSYISGARMTVAGAIASTGDQVISSDATLKENWRDLAYGVAEIAKAPVGTFEWKDGRGRSAGTTAQYWKTLLPELVHGEEGNMTLAYGQIALVNSILLARHETEQDKEIARLKARVRDLEKQLKMRI